MLALLQEVTLGNCMYCGKPAGFLRSKHAECEEQHQRGCDQITSEAIGAIKGTGPFSALEQRIAELKQSSFVFPEQIKQLFVRAWESAVEGFLEDGILDPAEESRLAEFKDHFGLSQSDLDGNGALTKIAKAAVLRDVLDGKIPQRMAVYGTFPINFHKGEKVIWAFSESKYLEDKTRRHYVGGSQGVSIRIMKGVYYRVGAFKGHPVESTERVHVDTGWVVVTDKNIYFAGPRKSLRLPYGKIVSFEPFSDGVGVMRDATTAKPQIFVTGDGWFTYNLVTNLSQL